MNRGDVFWVNLHPRSGSEQRGRRPCVIVSHDGFNQTPGWRSIIVVPLSTSKSQEKRGPTAVLLPQGSANLAEPSVALCHQVTTIDRSKLGQFSGSLPGNLVREIENGLKAALNLS